MKVFTKRLVKLIINSTLISCLGSFSIYAQKAGYVSGDFHQHTTYTDGYNSIKTVFYMNNKFGLNWWANSEHGGGFTTDAAGPLLTQAPFNTGGADKYWDQYSPNPIIGDVSFSSNHQKMWRWQSIRDYSFKDVLEARKTYPNKIIIQGYEWNVPGHEHCSMGNITNQFNASPNANVVAEFEFKFDNSNTDKTGGVAQGWVKSTLSGHEKAVEAAKWLQTNYSKESWLVNAHPERKKLYKVSDFRDFNNVAPDVCFGFESMPGHQSDTDGRGGYSKSADGAGTYGGTGIYAAKVGGLWDALLGEGRNWWLFASSDFHTTEGDFFPGEYQKNYTYVSDKTSAQSIVDGLRSGNNWVVEGDLIDSLDFSINGSAMGSQVAPLNGKANIKIVVRDPQTNNNNSYSDYKNPLLNHIDIIAGNITTKKTPGTTEYTDATNSSAKVIARFDAVGGVKDINGITSIKWTEKSNGIKEINFTYDVNVNTYFRLRGTNHGLNVANETDGAGNPLSDTLITNTATAAFADLWFYSNPIFVGNNLTPVEEQNNDNPSSFELKQNYPNPFNPSTVIEFTLPSDSKVLVKIYDVIGKEISTLLYEEKNAGNHKVAFDAVNLSSGVYIYVVDIEPLNGAARQTKAKRMVVLK